MLHMPCPCEGNRDHRLMLEGPACLAVLAREVVTFLPMISIIPSQGHGHVHMVPLLRPYIA